ncbi:MAG: Holliday junction branch migration protein RuvA [Candidatus Eutrophobiaceae bacterium]
MIAQLTGKLLWKQPPQLLLDVGGVGYELEAPIPCFNELPAVGSMLTLHTHLLVREDAHTLFGFTDTAQKKLFRSLLKVSGVGAKLALAILSTLNARDFELHLLDKDVRALVRVPGVGKKMAERIILEMRDRFMLDPNTAPHNAASALGHTNSVRDAIHALVSLGYKPQEANRFVNTLDTKGMDSETIIRAALRQSIS